MKRKQTVISRNYLDKIPFRPQEMQWKCDEEGIVTLEIENRGFMNRAAQKLFRRPRISYIHLDKFGSFIWQSMDGKKSITDIGKEVEARFGEEAYPLYERLAYYFKTLDSYHFVKWII